MRPELRQFIERSLSALESEAPECHAQLCERLHGRRVRVGGDGPPIVLAFSQQGVARLDGGETADVDVRLGRATLLALVDAELSLEEALRRDVLLVRGRIADLADTFDGLTLYLRGGVRCPSFPKLLAAYRMAQPAEDPLS